MRDAAKHDGIRYVWVNGVRMLADVMTKKDKTKGLNFKEALHDVIRTGVVPEQNEDEIEVTRLCHPHTRTVLDLPEGDKE